jgi:hypothetical protein
MDGIKPIHAQIFPVFTLLKELSVYFPGLAVYSFVEDLANTSAIIAQITPGTP